AFNTSIGGGDFGFNAQLFAFVNDAGASAPRVVSADPAAGIVYSFTNLTITFSEPVNGVDAGDLLVNGVPAGAVANSGTKSYTFSFPQPAFGSVIVTWAANHAIVDFDDPPKPFDGTAATSIFRYTFYNPNAPTVTAQTPAAGTVVTGLTAITATFSEAVSGVDAADLLVNGVPASGVSSSADNVFTFTFAQPPYGPVSITWAANHGIVDLEIPPSDFDPSQPGGQWSYTLVDPVPSVTITAPADNGVFLAPANITIQATASDNDGTIARVEFFEGANSLGQATNSPYAIIWSNVMAGDYVLQAVATDDSGLRATSAPVSVTVVTSLPVVLLRGPYLQVGTPTSGIVRWRT
ncbi:MAG TPA: Ig-like domain-containing protein, partial [Candidatus Dormibacteraeota bacterium]|nr:Ig-like domain-containing protein [Candidatus Dormibacteraeota bacterium]